MFMIEYLRKKDRNHEPHITMQCPVTAIIHQKNRRFMQVLVKPWDAESDSETRKPPPE